MRTKVSRSESSTSTFRSRSPRTSVSASARGRRCFCSGEASERYDLESYVAIHQGTIFGSLTLITGALWAKASWGVWWTWDSNQLVLFLVLFLFYCAYFMLRFSIEEGPRRARSSAVYALFGVVLIPISFLAIRLAEDFIHPTVFTREGPQMSGTMFLAFCVSWAAVTLLAYVLYRVELLGKRVECGPAGASRGTGMSDAE